MWSQKIEDSVKEIIESITLQSMIDDYHGIVQKDTHS